MLYTVYEHDSTRDKKNEERTLFVDNDAVGASHIGCQKNEIFASDAQNALHFNSAVRSCYNYEFDSHELKETALSDSWPAQQKNTSIQCVARFLY